MNQYKFPLPLLPLILGTPALILLPMLIQPEIVISFRLGLGSIIFFAGLFVTLWIQALAVMDSIREKKAHAEIETAIRDYEEGHRRFIRRLDHELKNPLMSLQASLENLQIATDLETRGKTHANMQKALERLIHLLRNLRKLSELEESILEREQVDIPELLAEIFEVVKSTPGREERQINLLVTQVPTPVPCKNLIQGVLLQKPENSFLSIGRIGPSLSTELIVRWLGSSSTTFSQPFYRSSTSHDYPTRKKIWKS